MRGLLNFMNQPFVSTIVLKTFQSITISAAVLASIIGILWIATYIQFSINEPLTNPAIQKLLAKYSQNLSDTQLKEDIRTLDWLSRKAYFTSQAQIRIGSYLFGIACFLSILFCKLTFVFQSQTLVPAPISKIWMSKQKQQLRWAIASFLGIFWLTALGAGLYVRQTFIELDQSIALAAAPVETQPLISLPAQAQEPLAQPQAATQVTQPQAAAPVEMQPLISLPAQEPLAQPQAATQVTQPQAAMQVTQPTQGEPMPAKSAEAQPALPDLAELQQNWPSFRGCYGLGIANAHEPPMHWDGKQGVNIQWKTSIPKPGFNSPIVWKNQVFLCGADAERKEVYSFDAITGTLLWKSDVTKIPGTPEQLPKVSQDTGYAAPTMATDGLRVYALFANGDLVCLTIQGQMVWAKNLGMPKNHYGHSSSLILYGQTLLIQYDHAKACQLLGLDSATGKILWQQTREVEISWASPILIPRSDATYLILSATPSVTAYHAATGALLWQQEYLGGEVAPSPAYAADRIFITNIGIALMALEPNTGQIAWECLEGEFPEVASPVANQACVWIANSHGSIRCFDVKTGQIQWEQEYDKGFYASPILCDDKVYAIDRGGTTHIFASEPTYKSLGECPLDEPVVATPAFIGRRIYIRSLSNLFCIEEKK